jgi:hypothetical protein
VSGAPPPRPAEPALAVRALALCAGLSDTATGVLLVVAPGLVLSMLGLPLPSEPVYMRWIGVFVASVGFAYALPFLRPAGPERTARLVAVFEVTAVVRFAVAAFLAATVGCGALETGWLTVGAFDAVVALAQFALLARGAAGTVGDGR